MFEAKPIPTEFTVPATPQALMQGEEVVALIFEERYAPLLSQCLLMLALVEKVAAAACDFTPDGTHDAGCCACIARELLENLPPVPPVH
jgi:hypothetical protein